MIYSNEELVRWWVGLTKLDRASLVQTILEKASPDSNVYKMAESAAMKIMTVQPGPSALAAFRKWAD